MQKKKRKTVARLTPKDRLLIWAGINHVAAQLGAGKAEILWKRVLDLT
jgi:hypothetical protein